MKRADFYILAAADVDSRQQFLAKLCQRILSAGHNIYIYCENEFNAHKLSELLWNFQPQSFLANAVCSEPTTAPITLGWPDNHNPQHREVIVNLSESIPEMAADFSRIAEIVIQQPEVLTGSRERFREYRQRGFEIQHNDMRKPRQAH
ncbi:MAG: DNA polymerase III subunit chi [Pseudomonadales bacterium]